MRHNFLLRSAFFLILVFFYTISYSQTKIITGIVSDNNGIPLSGATLSVPGINVNAVTGTNGIYSIRVPIATSVLTVSYVGMRPVEVSVNNQSVLNITLENADSRLSEVVVVGYGTKRRSDISSSISSINEDDIKDLPVSGIDQALQGKVSGVTVTSNSGQPGAGVSVRVRGVTSVNGNDPLYVIDGVPILTNTMSFGQDGLGGRAGQTAQSVLSTLNPSDIASIDILKDASAQAIYGSLGANGVVLVTTKRGKAGQGKIAYDVYYGWQEVPKLLSIMDLGEFARYNNSLVSEIRAAGGSIDSIGEFNDPSLLGPGTSWQDELFKIGQIQNHQLSFSGGHEKTTYYFSLNYFDQAGTIVGSGFNRFSARVNLDHQVKSWFRAGISTNLSKSDQEITLTDGVETPTAIVLYNSPVTPIKSANGEYITTTSLGGIPFGNQNGNPIATALLRDVTSNQTKAYGNIYAEIFFTKYLSLRNEAGFDFQLTENKAFQPLVRNSATNQSILAPNQLRQGRNNSYYWALKNFLTFNKTFGKHTVNAILGHESQYSHYDNQTVSVLNTTLNLPSTGAGTLDPSGTTGSLGDWAMESYIGRLNYTFDNKYSLSGSVRRDGASSFGPNKRIGYFSAGSAGWTITGESFANNIKWLNYLKLRVGIGSVGNQNSPVGNAYTTNIRLIPILPFGPAGMPQNVGNPDLSWESVVTYNAGLDATLFNRRIELSVDVYDKTTTDMILATTLPRFSGVLFNNQANQYNNIQPPVTNAGEISNKGIDISLTTYNIQQKDFSWRTNLVFSHYKNLLVKLNAPGAILQGDAQDFTAASIVNVTQAGGAVGTFYGYITDGLFRSEGELNSGTDWGLPVGATNIWLGDVRYLDISGPKGVPDGKIGSEDVSFIGDPNPDFTFGFTNTFQYKNFDLSVFFQGVYGNDIYNWSRTYTEAMNNAYANQSTDVMNRYTPDNITSNIPRYNQWNNNNLRISDRFIEDGSYVRLQNLALGYNVPANWAKKVKMNAARLYLSAQNVFVITNYSGYDPEIGAFNKNVLSQNVDNGHYPNPRTFTIGANIEF